MLAKLGQILITDLLLPLLKDGIFMLVNFFKVRQLRKEQEAKAIKAGKDYEENPSDDTFGRLP